MKLLKINALLLGAIGALSFSSCDNEVDNDSVVTEFAQFSPTFSGGSTTAPTLGECGATPQVVTFYLDAEKQINDMTLDIGVGESSTATEGEDFDLVTHSVDVLAYGGQDGIPVEIIVYQDFDAEESNETIYLTFTSTLPSGMPSTATEMLAANIEESGLTEERNQLVDFTFDWEYTADPAADICADGYDLDFTINEGGPSYGSDYLYNDASTLACGESATLDMHDMDDNVVLTIWAWVYAAADPAEDLTIVTGFDRADTDLSGELTVTGAVNSGMDGDAVAIGTVEKFCDVLYIKNNAGEVVAEGRMNASGSYKIVKVGPKTL